MIQTLRALLPANVTAERSFARTKTVLKWIVVRKDGRRVLDIFESAKPKVREPSASNDYSTEPVEIPGIGDVPKGIRSEVAAAIVAAPFGRSASATCVNDPGLRVRVEGGHAYLDVVVLGQPAATVNLGAKTWRKGDGAWTQGSSLKGAITSAVTAGTPKTSTRGRTAA